MHILIFTQKMEVHFSGQEKKLYDHDLPSTYSTLPEVQKMIS